MFLHNTLQYNVYEDNCLYKSCDTASEAIKTAKFIRENIGASTTVYKEQFGEPIKVNETETRYPIISSVRIPC